MNPYILGWFIYGMFDCNNKLHSAFLKSSLERYKNIIILNKLFKSQGFKWFKFKLSDFKYFLFEGHLFVER